MCVCFFSNEMRKLFFFPFCHNVTSLGILEQRLGPKKKMLPTSLEILIFVANPKPNFCLHWRRKKWLQNYSFAVCVFGLSFHIIFTNIYTVASINFCHSLAWLLYTTDTCQVIFQDIYMWHACASSVCNSYFIQYIL